MNMYVPLVTMAEDRERRSHHAGIMGITGAGRAAVVAIGLALLPGCSPALLGQTDAFGEKVAKGCGTVAECDQLREAAWARHRGCKPNTIGKLKCSDTWKDYAAAKALSLARTKAAKDESAERERAQTLQALQPRQATEAEVAAASARQAKARAITEEEIRTGRCDVGKVDRLRKLPSWVDQIHASDQNALVTVDAQRFIVATEAPASFQLSTGFQGEYHVIAASFAPAKLTVADAQGYPVHDESFIAEELTGLGMGGPSVQGTRVHASAGDVRVSIAGRGCVLVMMVHRLPL